MHPWAKYIPPVVLDVFRLGSGSKPVRPGSAGGRVRSGSTVRGLRLRRLSGLAVHRVQYAIDELYGFFARKLARQLQRLVDRHRRGRSAAGHFVYGHAQDVAIDHRHPFEAPVRRVARNALVHLGPVFDGAAHERRHERVALRPLLRVERLVVGVDGVVDRLLASVERVENLQRALPGPAAGRHQGACRSVRMRLAISMAVMAASKPLLPPLAPARSIACSSVLVVSTPKATGTPVEAAACAIPLAASAAT